MLPSDHFVRMYNELFKMLAESEHSQEGLKKYWMWISRPNDSNQGLGSYIKVNGFQGMFEYWDHIKFEENCDMDMNITDEYFELKMHKCPSLSKNLDNDAGLCLQYCEHCAGWIHPIIRKHGFFPVYDIISPTEPRCHFRAYKDRELAVAFSLQARKLWDPYDDLINV